MVIETSSRIDEREIASKQSVVVILATEAQKLTDSLFVDVALIENTARVGTYPLVTEKSLSHLSVDRCPYSRCLCRNGLWCRSTQQLPKVLTVEYT